MSGKGSGGNVLAALCSFFIPGLGQLLQGRVIAGVLYFIFAGILWVLTLGFFGWIAHLISTLDAALYSPKDTDISITERKCPYCAETIKADAVLCRFCGKELETVIRPVSQSTGNCYLCNKRFPEEDLTDRGGEIFCSSCVAKINPNLFKKLS